MSIDIKNTKFTAPFVLFILGIATRFAYISHPHEVVFDEVHFGKFVSGYFTGEYFFDIHPPLGKLLIALAAYIGGFRPGFDFNVIGEGYSNASYVALRLLPNLFGALVPVCIYFFVRSLRGSVLAAFFAGLVLVFENAILVQSHYILVDSMLIFFGFLGITLFFHYRNFSKKPVHIFAAGIFLALAASVKWTGLSFLALVYLVSLIDLGKDFFNPRHPSFKETMRRGLMLILFPFLIYFSIFAVHFSLLDKSGPGDGFMSPRFLKNQAGSYSSGDPSVEPLGLWGKFSELNARMYTANATLTATHPYSSKFYSWPLMTRPIYYWVKQETPDTLSRIYLIGNPFIWWMAIAGLIAAFLYWKSEPGENKWILYAGWFLNFLPFFNVKRVMFLYHYLPALIFSIVITSLFLFDGKRDLKLYQYRTAILVLMVILFIAGFWFFMPLSYGLPLTTDQYNLRLWFESWL